MAAAAATVGWDADGVLIDSHPIALQATADIAELLAPAVQLGTQVDLTRARGVPGRNDHLSTSDVATLRAMHRLVMRARATRVALFDEALAVVRLLRCPPILITAAFAVGVRQALGGHASLFKSIMGRESNTKEELLAGAAQSMALYITDTVRDIARCRNVGLPVVAVGWGYDGADDLIRATPDCFVSTPRELTRFLAAQQLLTSTGGHHVP